MQVWKWTKPHKQWQLFRYYYLCHYMYTCVIIIVYHQLRIEKRRQSVIRTTLHYSLIMCYRVSYIIYQIIAYIVVYLNMIL